MGASGDVTLCPFGHSLDHSEHLRAVLHWALCCWMRPGVMELERGAHWLGAPELWGGRRRFLWRTLDEAQGWDAVGTAGRSSSGPNRSMGWRRPWASPSSENLLVSIGNLKLEDSLKVCTVFFSSCVRKQTTSSFFLEKGLVNLSGEMGAWAPGPSVLLKNLLPTSDALKKHK